MFDFWPVYSGERFRASGPSSCSHSTLYLSIFLSFQPKFVSQFSQKLCEVESSNMVYICRMSDCTVGLRLRVMALILLFFIHFSFFPYIACYFLKFVSEFS